MFACADGKGGKEDVRGPGKAAKNLAVDSEHGTSEGISSLPRTKSHYFK
jgi:hypothetical protein